jgi:hypothetical protein
MKEIDPNCLGAICGGEANYWCKNSVELFRKAGQTSWMRNNNLRDGASSLETAISDGANIDALKIRHGGVLKGKSVQQVIDANHALNKLFPR